MIACDGIVNAADSVSKNVSRNLTCTAPVNSANTVFISFDERKVGYKKNCDILYTVLLELILLLIIAIFCYHYAKHWSKHINNIKNSKMENKEF